jgi:hypothetical protein
MVFRLQLLNLKNPPCPPCPPCDKVPNSGEIHSGMLCRRTPFEQPGDQKNTH